MAKDDFKAIVIEKAENGQRVELKRFADADLMSGDVTVRVTHSTMNYKDALAITGKAPIARRWPMIAGIDFAGIVESSSNQAYKEGDAVLLNGHGTGETHLGALAERTRVPADWLIPLPQGLSAASAMAIGTAGYTAMLCVMALERHGLTPAQGPAIVTGAAGGVGSFAVKLLKQAGYHVIASTGRTSEADYLNSLGADEVLDRAELQSTPRALGKERWAAGVDSVGSKTLANLLASTKYGGAISACGLAGGMDLPASVAPFILRGVSLLGIDSVQAPRDLRVAAWSRLAKSIDAATLAATSKTIGLEDVIETAPKLLAGQVRGRLVVEIDA